MSVKVIRWLGIVIPVSALLALEALRTLWELRYGSHWLFHILYFGLITVGAAFFSCLIYSLVESAQKEIQAHNRRLHALFQVANALNSSLDRNTFFQKTLDLARQHLEADYGEILVIEGGKYRTWYAGYDPRSCPVKEVPKLRGLKGKILRTGEPFLVKNRAEDPDSVPLPPGHPEIGPLVGAPVLYEGRQIAHLILARKPGRPPFTQEDLETLVALADALTVAIERENYQRQIQEIALLRERDRIARDLHDGLGQVLGYINVTISSLERRLVSGQKVDLFRYLEELKNAARSAYQEVRQAIFEWKLIRLPEQPLPQEISRYVEEFAVRNGILPEISLDGLENFDLPIKAKIQVLRILQEALSNVQKHAQATRIRVQGMALNGTRTLIIEDNGKGFNPKDLPKICEEPHFGLQTMQERAESIGARLRIESAEGKGTRIVLQIPASLEQAAG